ncbi:MAG: hypothetical protein ACK55Z_18165 [bacterium]
MLGGHQALASISSAPGCSATKLDSSFVRLMLSAFASILRVSPSLLPMLTSCFVP